MAAEARVLEQPAALGAVAASPGRRGRSCRTGCAARRRDRSCRRRRASTQLRALPLAVGPVGVAVAGPEVQRDEAERLDLDRRAASRRCPSRCRVGAVRVTAARPVVDVDLAASRAAPTRPSGHTRTASLSVRWPSGSSCGDHDDREVVEAQRHVRSTRSPRSPSRRRSGRAVGVADRPDAPRPVAGPEPGVGRHRDGLARRPRSRPSTCRPARSGMLCRMMRPVVDQTWRLLLDRGERTVPREVERDAVLVGLADQAHLLAAARSPRSGTARPAGAGARRPTRRTCAPCCTLSPRFTVAYASTTPRFG